MRKATRPSDSSAVSRQRAGGGEQERKQPLRTDGAGGRSERVRCTPAKERTALSFPLGVAVIWTRWLDLSQL